ncbi:HEAT repeat protein [Rubellimicrobium mesophilum DSM 19309]|uniref:HEAT repeat protein n=1 Tax=Rubellimicrobium mesophilum DSM 19309 TaxID=442562 RepID=A0A017HSG4_9RHOB|nr:hypothetical protein [Rubellimicrobium mesophilum]EYD77437.1 HEAT repeat protein [Rubellimicrobium mesophilum DSM 19309]
MNWNRPVLNSKVLRLHAENAAFLARQVELARDGPVERLVDLYNFEGRLNGHLTALSLAGGAGLDMALEALDEGQGFGEILVALHLSLRLRPNGDLVAHLPANVLTASNAPALGAAVALLAPMVIGGRLRRWMGSADPLANLVAIEVCGRLRVDPRDYLGPLLTHGGDVTAARAARLAGEIGRIDLLPSLLDVLRHSASGLLRFDAARAATLLGDRSDAPSALAELPPEAPAWMWREMAELLPLVMPSDKVRAVIARLLGQEATQRWAVVAAGALGAPDTLDWLIRQMEVPQLARVAGLAFGLVTGARLGPENLELAEFPEDPDDPAVEASPVETFIESHTYWPDPEKVSAWLRHRRDRLVGGERYLLGAAAWTHPSPPESADRTQIALRALSLEIAIRSPRAPLPNWRSPVFMHDRGFDRTW